MSDVDDAGTLDAGAGPEGAGRSPALVLAISLAVLFAVAAAVLGVVASRSGGDESDRVKDLRSTAGEVGEALLTYDYKDPKAHEERLLALATGSFRSEYQDFLDQGGLTDLIKNLKAEAQGFVKDVYVSEIDEERAEVIVRLDVTRNGTGGPRTLYDIYELLSFVRVDGRWKVDQVTDLNFATSGLDGTSSGSTTSTTTPVP